MLKVQTGHNDFAVPIFTTKYGKNLLTDRGAILWNRIGDDHDSNLDPKRLLRILILMQSWPGLRGAIMYIFEKQTMSLSWLRCVPYFCDHHR